MDKRSTFCSTGVANLDQTKEYINKSMDLFYRELTQAMQNNNKDKIIYYSDCLKLFQLEKFIFRNKLFNKISW